MSKIISYKTCFTLRLDNKWEWYAVVWLTKRGMFADCIIKSPDGILFDSQADARKNMEIILKKFGIHKKMLTY